ncbi:MAG: universal stress protein [Candidatus Aminicenantes bacterium]
MFKKAVLATDFSPGAEKLLGCLGELKALGTKEIILTWVMEINLAGGPSGSLQEEHKKKLEDKVREIEKMGFKAIYEAPIGLPAGEINAVAEKTGASLIVIGSRGRNKVREFFLGSTVSDLIRQTRTKVLIERIKLVESLGKKDCQLVCERKFESILMPTDFSPAAAEAEKVVSSLAEHAGKIVLVSVVDQGETEDDISALKTKASKQLDQLKKRCRSACPAVKVRIETGIASKHIKAIAEEEDATLIVLGMRGKGGVEGLVLGSTAETVARTSNRPVLLVPAAKPSRKEEVK